MINITLFTKEGCHLCEVVKEELAGLNGRFPHTLHEIDITADADLWQKYRYRIPVLHIGDVELAAPIGREQLEAALASVVYG
jgi:hypothetical protein